MMIMLQLEWKMLRFYVLKCTLYCFRYQYTTKNMKYKGILRCKWHGITLRITLKNIELCLDNLVFLDGKKISIRNLFLFMLISPVKNRWGVNEEIWDFSRFVDFSCTSLTGMCILIIIRKKVMETLTWDRLIITVWKAYSLWITFIFTLNHSFLVS